jgi:outer membrane protein
MNVKLVLLPLIITIFSINTIFSQESEKKAYPEQNWALGLSFRVASIPFATEETKTVGSAVPLLFFRGKYFYMRGIEGGFRFYRTGDWRFCALGRLRFFDIPKEYQNQVQGDNVEWGLQATYKPFELPHLDLELLSDWLGNFSSNVRLGINFDNHGFRIDPYIEFKFKSKKYNSYYYGLTLEDIGFGTDISLGIIADYHVWSNFYFYGAARVTLLDKGVRKSTYVNSDVYASAFLGFGFSNDRSRPKKERLKISPYVRLAHGWATPSNLSNILKFNAEKDTFNNQLTSVFYGLPLTDDFFGLPIDFYLTTGFIWHWKSSVQPHSQEVVVAIKLYYTIPWPIRWRLGAAEGFSYVNKIPYVEATEMAKKEYRPSNLLNFLDFSLDLNMGDIFGGKDLERLWLGYSIHHRSAIFETAQHLGRISGGSNYQTVYLQWHF